MTQQKNILERFTSLSNVAKKYLFNSRDGFKESFPWLYDFLSEDQKSQLPSKNILIEKSEDVYNFLKKIETKRLTETRLIQSINALCE